MYCRFKSNGDVKMKLEHENLQNGYEIKCSLCKGRYKYMLYYNDELIFSFKDKYTPENLPRLGNINRLINKISNVKNIGTQKKIKELKTDLYEEIIDNLSIDFLENECVFDKYHQTNGCVYNHKDTIIFYFMVKSVKKYKNDIYEVTTIQQNNAVFTYQGSLNDILIDLIDANLVLINYNNYKFIFNMLINTVLLGD